MEAIEYIRKNLTGEQVKELLEHLGFNSVHLSSGSIRACCKMHGGDNPSSFVYSLNNGMWHCHVCKEGGDMAHIIQHLQDVSFPVAVQYILNFIGIHTTDMVFKERTSAHMKELKAYMKFCNAKIVEIKSYDIGVETKQITGFRDFKKETLEHFGMCYVKEMPFTRSDGEKATLYNRLGCPIYFRESVVAYALRRVNECDIPKWLYQPTGFDKKYVLYNYKDKWFDEVVIVEGAFDVWAWHEVGKHAVAVLGSSLSDEQINLLTSMTTDVVLSFDGDMAGRLATQKAIDKLKHKFNVKVVCFEEGSDPCDLPREELMQHYIKKVHYSKFNTY